MKAKQSSNTLRDNKSLLFLSPQQSHHHNNKCMSVQQGKGNVAGSRESAREAKENRRAKAKGSAESAQEAKENSGAMGNLKRVRKKTLKAS